ncbi:hypothetical protein LTR53_002522 [Teratosphaeriaceae sp. CCFEE 6253]|nr:hypothetical protein LTR53_002522 [Teratosphaeriaceae sp. CCFEE 6253]
MQTFAVLALAASGVSASLTLQRLSHGLSTGLDRRQGICVPVEEPVTCERSCGPGNVICIAFPTCYNPSAGESCCSNGRYCPADYYCTDGGCCPTGSSLEECGATATLSTLPPPASTTSSSSSSSSSLYTSSSSVAAAVTASSASTSSAARSSSFASTSSSSTSVYVAPVYTPSSSSSSHSATVTAATYTGPNATTSLPAQQTTNEGMRAVVGYLLYPLGLLGGLLVVV